MTDINSIVILTLTLTQERDVYKLAVNLEDVKNISKTKFTLYELSIILPQFSLFLKKK